MRLPIFICLLILFCANPAFALSGEWQRADHVGLRLVSDTDAVGANTFGAGVDIDLENGWYSYWRMPGEGGLAPVFDWKDSQNVKSVAISWPLPERIETMGLYSFGYRGGFLFPVSVTVDDPSKPALLSVKADIMVCHDICIPQHMTAQLNIPAGKVNKSPEADRIALARKSVPHNGDLPALKIRSAVLGPKAIVIRAWSQKGFGEADLFVEAGQDVPFSFSAPPKIEPDKNDPRNATISVAAPDDADNIATALMHKSVTLTLVQKDIAIEKVVGF